MSWKHESQHPSGYQVTPDSFAQQQVDGKAKGKYFRVETHSKVIPYVVREHAWNFDHHDNTNFERYRADAPDGYKEHIQWITPHPTNKAYYKPKAPIVIEEEEEEVPAPAAKGGAAKGGAVAGGTAAKGGAPAAGGKSAPPTTKPAAKNPATPPASTTTPPTAKKVQESK